MVWLFRSIESTCRIRLVITSSASCSTKAPPESPVPLPRATKGTPCSWQSFNTAATCSVESGSTAKGG